MQVFGAIVVRFLLLSLCCFLAADAPPGSKRAVWGERALGLGALLSFVYTLLLAMLLSEFYFIPNSAITGYGYQ